MCEGSVDWPRAERIAMEASVLGFEGSIGLFIILKIAH